MAGDKVAIMINGTQIKIPLEIAAITPANVENNLHSQRILLTALEPVCSIKTVKQKACRNRQIIPYSFNIEPIYTTTVLPGTGTGYLPSASGSTGGSALKSYSLGDRSISELIASSHEITFPE